MTYNDILTLIADNASPDSWLHDDGVGIWTLKEDVNLTIREIRDEDREFHEEWAEKVPDKNAVSQTFEIFYGASFIERRYLVSVDGHRATVPIPKGGTHEIAAKDYIFAQCVDFQGSLDEYIQRCGLSVEK